MRPARSLSMPRPVSIADGDLVRRALEGDRQAEDTLFRRYAGSLGGLIARLLGRREEAEDVLHDTFVTAFEKLERLRNPDAFRPWVTQIAITHVRRKLRRKRLARGLGLLPMHDDTTLERLAAPTVSPEARADLAVVDGVLRAQPPQARTAWMLRYVEGHRLEDVAELTGCSLATAKRRIARVRDALKDVIEMRETEE